MKNKYALIGAGGHAKVIIEIIEACGNEIEMINDNVPPADRLHGYPVSVDLPNAGTFVIVSVGNNVTRKKIVARTDAKYASAVHPGAIVSPRASVGEGTVIMAGAILNSDVRVGKHCIVNTNASVDHECVLEDFVHISPGVSLGGNVIVGEGTQIGIGSSVIQGIRIGKWCTIGAGAAIIEDVPDNAVVVGVPGKIIKYNKE